MERPEALIQREESMKATQDNHAGPATGPPTLTNIPLEVRLMIYGFVLGDQTIHIKSDVIPQEPYPGHDEDEDEDSENNIYDGEEEEEVEWPADILEVWNSNRGPLYHSLCDNELLHPRDARLYRIRNLEAHGSRESRGQSEIKVKDFRLAKYKMESNLNLECELIGSDNDEDTPTTRQSQLGIPQSEQACPPRKLPRSSIPPKTFGFDDAATFAKILLHSTCHHHVLDTNGSNLLFTDRKRHPIRPNSAPKPVSALTKNFLWTGVLNAATSHTLPGLNKDPSHILTSAMGGDEYFVDGTLWQSCPPPPQLPAPEDR